MATPWWDPQDLLEFLCVEAHYEEMSLAHTYSVSRGGLTLDLAVSDTERTLTLVLRHDGSASGGMEMHLLVRGRITYRREKWGEFLKVTDCVAVPLTHLLTDYEADPISVPGERTVDVEIAVTPEIRVSVGVPG